MSAVARDDRLARFLLGELGPEEQERLEAEFFARDDAFEELLAAEDDLIDAYTGGMLIGERRDRFEARYLRSREGSERVEFSRALRRRAGRRPSSRTWMPLAASLAVIALLAGAIVYPVVQRTRNELAQSLSQRDALERQLAAQEARAAEQGRRLDRLADDLAQVRSDRDRVAELLGAPDTPVKIASFTLTAGQLRDPAGGQRMTIPAATTLVRLVLLLETGEYASYRATIETAEGRRVWDAPELLPRKARRGPAVTVLVPADRLPPGDYVLALRGVTRDGRDEPAAEYSLQVSSSR